MNAPINWQKSSFSEPQSECVELATVDGTIRLRESDTPGAIVTTTPAALGAFLRRAKKGEFDAVARAR